MSVFRFRHFDLIQSEKGLKMNTDSMLLGAFANASLAKTAADFGCGTGVLSLMLAQRFPNLQILGIELDAGDASVAAENFEKSRWSERLTVVRGNVFEFQFPEKVDLVICNPPYFVNSMKAQTVDSIRVKHTFHKELQLFFHKAFDACNKNGSAWFILPYQEDVWSRDQFSSIGWFIKKSIHVYPKPDSTCIRVIFELSKKEVMEEKSLFVIRNEDNSYSSQYRELTKEFHGVEI